MGQAKIKRDRQRVEAEKRKADASIRPSMLIPSGEPFARTADSKTITFEQFQRLLTLSQEQGIRIRYEDVPLKRRSDDSRFFESYEQMYNEMTNVHWVSAFCLHEAEHRLYLALLGITEFDYI